MLFNVVFVNSVIYMYTYECLNCHRVCASRQVQENSILKLLNDLPDCVCMLMPKASHKYIFKNKSWNKLQKDLLSENT